MSGSERGAPPVQLPGPAMRALVRAVAQMSKADLGRWAVIGGVAVAARLGQAHRVTADVDTVVDQDRLSAAIAVPRALLIATADPAGGPTASCSLVGIMVVIEGGQLPARQGPRRPVRPAAAPPAMAATRRGRTGRRVLARVGLQDWPFLLPRQTWGPNGYRNDACSRGQLAPVWRDA